MLPSLILSGVGTIVLLLCPFFLSVFLKLTSRELYDQLQKAENYWAVYISISIFFLIIAGKIIWFIRAPWIYFDEFFHFLFLICFCLLLIHFLCSNFDLLLDCLLLRLQIDRWQSEWYIKWRSWQHRIEPTKIRGIKNRVDNCFYLTFNTKLVIIKKLK